MEGGFAFGAGRTDWVLGCRLLECPCCYNKVLVFLRNLITCKFLFVLVSLVASSPVGSLGAFVEACVDISSAEWAVCED